MNPAQTIDHFGEITLTMEDTVAEHTKMPHKETTKEEKKSPPQTKTNHKVKTTKGNIDKKYKNTADVLSAKKKTPQNKINLKTHENNDDDSVDESGSDWEEDSDEDDEYVLDETMYATLLNQLFPSAYSKEKADKAKQAKKEDKSVKNVSKTETKKTTTKEHRDTNKTKSKHVDKNTPTEIVTRSKTQHKKPAPKRQTKFIDEILEEDDDEEEYVPSTEYDSSESESDYEEDLEDELMELLSGKGMQKFNVTFEFGGHEDEDTDEEEDTDEDEDTDDEKLDEASFKNYAKEDYERDIQLLEQFNKINSQLKQKHTNSAILNFMDDKSKSLKKSIEKFQQKGEKKSRTENMKKFKKIISGDKRLNDKKYFEKRPIDEQCKIIKQLEEISVLTQLDVPYKFKLLETDIPLQLKACAMKKIEMFKYMDTGMSEYYKLKNWIDTFMEIPFGKYKGLPISMDDGVESCRNFMTSAKETLDKVAFGLDDAKMQIIQMIGTWITNPSAIGSAIAIQGPPGTGKTTLVKEGISKIMGRDFAFIALGGATDSSFLEGHGYTYEGSKWGKIVDILVQCKSMNPIIYFDELDKISDTPKGEEIVGILTHLTDTTQNSNFHDKYFSEIEFDLSKCLFIFSYNDESKINPILKDRMYRIYTQDYNKQQKQVIAQNYLMPKIRETIKFKDDEIIVNNSIIDYINMNYVENEKGVRNMKRCLEIIFMKLNLFRFIDSDSTFFDEQVANPASNAIAKKKENKFKVTFPLTLTTDLVDKLLKRNKPTDGVPHLYM
jgi:hypothetical protein